MNVKTLKRDQHVIRKRSKSCCGLEWFFKCFIFSVAFFYLGLMVGYQMSKDCDCTNDYPDHSQLRSPETMMAELNRIGSFVEKQNGNEEQLTILLNDMKQKLNKLEAKAGDSNSNNNNNQGIPGETARAMEKLVEGHKKNEEQWAVKLNDMKQKLEQAPKQKLHHQDVFAGRHTGSFASGMEFVDRDDFGALFDTGVPLDNSGWGNDQVFILYSDHNAMPDKNATPQVHPNGGQAVLSVEDATKNCRNLHVVLNAVERQRQCIAVMGQFESFHLQKFMRMAEGEKQSERVVDMKLPLRLVNRNMMLNGEQSITPPPSGLSKIFWKNLSHYLESLQGVLNELKPIAESVASHNAHNTIIVVVCNFIHSELLINFVCNAHAKGLETSTALKSILVFATDIETHQLAQSLGLTSFYSKAVFGVNSQQEIAGDHGNMATVYCIHLISQLGYDFLFQDVNVVWYKDPLSWFNSEKPDHPVKKWDMIYQDEGGRSVFSAPYSGDTGFYFVRNNQKTLYFFNQLLMMGDLISSITSSRTFIVLLAEQASLYGLKIKTWNRLTDEFPGGYSYHNRLDYMKKLVLSKNSTEGRGLIKMVGDDNNHDGDHSGVVDPWILHMSWTASNDNELKYFKQMGEWYVNDKCSSSSGNSEKDMVQKPTRNGCCAAKPLITCYYKDKPSIIPCPDSPFADKATEKSFW